MRKTAIYLGHYREDIYTVLAKEEAMHEVSVEWGAPVLMTCEITPSAITIAEREDIYDIRVEECREDGIDFTRRLGAGSVIWLDEKILAYFFVSPRDKKDRKDIADEFGFHREVARKIAGALRMLGVSEVYVGEKFSIGLGPGPQYVISGNAAAIKGKVLSYHGVLVLDKLNIAAIKKYIVLRKNETVDEEKLLSRLPSLYEVMGKRVEIREVALRLVLGITDAGFRMATDDEKRQLEISSRHFMEKYRSHRWIFEPEVVIEHNAGFCLIALSETWEERNFYKVE